EATEMGPLISKEHLEKVTNYVNNGIKEGATLAVGGDQPENPALANGFFYLPTELTTCIKDMDVVKYVGCGQVINVVSFTSGNTEVDTLDVGENKLENH